MIEVVYRGNDSTGDKAGEEKQTGRAGKTDVQMQEIADTGRMATSYVKNQAVNKKPAMRTLKNIRQIGTSGQDMRIYVENSVIGFLREQEKRHLNCLAALLGTVEHMDGSTFIYVQGVALADRIHIRGTRLEFDMQAYQMIQEDMETFFPKLSMIGWFLPVTDLLPAYGNVLGERGGLFFLVEEEQEEGIFYLLQNGHTVAQKGYYIYYENNEEMKSYLMACGQRVEKAGEPKNVKHPLEKELHKEGQWGDPSSKKEARFSESRPAERQSISEKEEKEKRHQKSKNSVDMQDKEFVDDYEMAQSEQREMGKITSFLYATSAVLAIVVLVIGITLVNNYEKMYELQDSLNTVVGVLRQSEQQGGALENAELQVNQEGVTDAVQTAQEGAEAAAQAGQEGAVNPEQTAQREESAEQADQEEQSGQAVEGNVDPVLETMQDSFQYYTIEPGDTLASISRKIYNTEDMINAICEANNIQSESELIVGEKILLP